MKMMIRETGADGEEDDRMTKKIFVGSLALVILTVLHANQTTARSYTYFAQLIAFQGKISVYRDARRIPVKKGMYLEEDDKIRTGRGTYADIAFDKTARNIIRMEEQSELMIIDLHPRHTELNVFKGSVLSRVKALRKKSKFTVRTPVSTSGVRGTGWKITAGKLKNVIESHEGKIFVAGLDQNGNPIGEKTLSAGWKIMVEQFGRPAGQEKLTQQEKDAWQQWLKQITKRPKKSRNIDKIKRKLKGGLKKAIEGKADSFETKDVDRIEDRRGGGPLK
jgi:hypothetical protein